MASEFLIYGANGYVGEAAAHLAIQLGLRPILGGRNAAKLEILAKELGLEKRVFDLDEASIIDQALKDVAVVLHCAGPFIHTSKPIVESCLRTGTHYLDLTGEIAVYESLAARDADAKAKGIMILPGVGFDVVPTDCLALHLKQRLPSATHLTIAFQSEGPGGLPPGTQRTVIESIPYGDWIRSDGKLMHPKQAIKTRAVDFGKGPVSVTRLTWGDVFTAYFSTSIPNIEDYLFLPDSMKRQLASLKYLRPFFSIAAVRNLLKRGVKPGPSAELRALTSMHVWAEVEDDEGRKAVSRLHGPEAGLIWTTRAALSVVQKVLKGIAPIGFQTPALAYGSDFVLETEGVTREDVN